MAIHQQGFGNSRQSSKAEALSGLDEIAHHQLNVTNNALGKPDPMLLPRTIAFSTTLQNTQWSSFKFYIIGDEIVLLKRDKRKLLTTLPAALMLRPNWRHSQRVAWLWTVILLCAPLPGPPRRSKFSMCRSRVFERRYISASAPVCSRRISSTAVTEIGFGFIYNSSMQTPMLSEFLQI